MLSTVSLIFLTSSMISPEFISSIERLILLISSITPSWLKSLIDWWIFSISDNTSFELISCRDLSTRPILSNILESSISSIDLFSSASLICTSSSSILRVMPLINLAFSIFWTFKSSILELIFSKIFFSSLFNSVVLIDDANSCFFLTVFSKPMISSILMDFAIQSYDSS